MSKKDIQKMMDMADKEGDLLNVKLFGIISNWLIYVKYNPIPKAT
jgi:hypothetical protein